MRSIAVYLVERLYGGPEEGGWYYDSVELCTDPALTAFGVTFAEGHEDRARTMALEVQRISIAIGTSAITRARSAASSPLVASRPTSTTAGSFSPFRPSVPATNDPNRLGFPFCQPSEVRSHEELHRPLPSTLPITVRKSRSRRKMSLAPAAPRLMRCIRPTGGKASIRSIPLMSAQSLKVRTSILGALSRKAAMPPSCPSQGVL